MSINIYFDSKEFEKINNICLNNNCCRSKFISGIHKFTVLKMFRF